MASILQHSFRKTSKDWPSQSRHPTLCQFWCLQQYFIHTQQYFIHLQQATSFYKDLSLQHSTISFFKIQLSDNNTNFWAGHLIMHFPSQISWPQAHRIKFHSLNQVLDTSQAKNAPLETSVVLAILLNLISTLQHDPPSPSLQFDLLCNAGFQP